jgi:hypothetical protein
MIKELNLDRIFFEDRSCIPCRVCGKMPKKDFVARRITLASMNYMTGSRKDIDKVYNNHMNFIFVDSAECKRKFESSWAKESASKMLDELYDSIMEEYNSRREPTNK